MKTILTPVATAEKKGEFCQAEEQHRGLKWRRANYIWTHSGCVHQHTDKLRPYFILAIKTREDWNKKAERLAAVIWLLSFHPGKWKAAAASGVSAELKSERVRASGNLPLFTTHKSRREEIFWTNRKGLKFSAAPPREWVSERDQGKSERKKGHFSNKFHFMRVDGDGGEGGRANRQRKVMREPWKIG